MKSAVNEYFFSLTALFLLFFNSKKPSDLSDGLLQLFSAKYLFFEKDCAIVTIVRKRFLRYSSIAQSVEHAAVNRAVVGSSPTRGAFFVLSDEPDDW